MDKKIRILLILALLLIFVTAMFNSMFTGGRQTVNPYEYNVDEFKKVDESLISYRETQQIAIESGDPKAIASHAGHIYLLTDEHLQVITADGQEILKKILDANPKNISVTHDGAIVIAFENFLVAYDLDGIETARSEVFGEKSLFTAMAIWGNSVFVADAGERRVLIFDRLLENTGNFKGESGYSDLHGLIIPSLHFDLAVNDDGELWVVNPGIHSVQNYSADGRLRGHWGNPSFRLDGFSGCCNPSYIAFLSDGRYVTSEKGIIRVKIYKPSGEFESVVAAPDKFPNGHRAPALAVDKDDNVLILDFDKKMVRLFRSR
jgi:hypothetical protein